MRKIFKDHQNPPPDLIGDGCYDQLVNIVANRNGSLSTYYSRPSILNALNLLYFNKCGYCETKIDVPATENIEHYRPKAGVDEQDLTPGTNHKGYYWLGNEWTNLLIACPKCNQSGHKGTRFPLRNSTMRVVNHPNYVPAGGIDFELNHFGLSPLAEEDPLIINPERTNPDLHFSINDAGEIKIARKSIYAITTRDVCNLDRQPLKIARKKVMDDIIVKISQQIEQRYHKDEPLTDLQYGRQLRNIFKKIHARIDNRSEYTMVGRNMIRNFETLIAGNDKIDEIFRPDIIRHYLAYLAENG